MYFYIEIYVLILCLQHLDNLYSEFLLFYNFKVKWLKHLSDCRFYPRYGTSVTHLPQSSTRSKQNNETFDDQRNKELLNQRNNRLSWPQISSPNQLPYSNKQRIPSDNENKQSLRRVINPEEAKVFERANQIVMYVLY